MSASPESNEETTKEVIRPEEVRVLSPSRWVTGVKPEVTKKVAEILKKGKRYFGSSGAYMTHQAANPEFTSVEGANKEAAKENLDAERKTTKALQDWIKDKPGAVLIDSVYVPELGDEEKVLHPETGMIEGVDTDHVVLIGGEVILIDTKSWKKKKNYGVADDGSALMSNKPFPGNEIKLSTYIDNWLDYLHEDAYITTLVCINNEEVTVVRARNWYVANYRLVEIDKLIELLDSKWDMIEPEDKREINSTLVSQVLMRAVKPFDEYSKVFDMDNLRKFQSR